MRSVAASARLELHALISSAVDAAVVLIEGPGGYGKTVLSGDIAAAQGGLHVRCVLDGVRDAPSAVATSLRHIGLLDLANLIIDPAADGPAALLDRSKHDVVLVVDELQRATPDDLRWLVALATGPISRHGHAARHRVHLSADAPVASSPSWWHGPADCISPPTCSGSTSTGPAGVHRRRSQSLHMPRPPSRSGGPWRF